MTAKHPTRQWWRFGTAAIGFLLPLIVWLSIKYGMHVEDRYLPSPFAVATAYRDITPSIFVQAAASLARLAVGGVAGAFIGIAFAIAMHAYPTIDRLWTPFVQTLRSVPSVATVPFFIVWFGFAERGRLLLILLGVGLNVLVAAHQILKEMPEKYQVALLSFGHMPNSFPITVSYRVVLEHLLPTLRTSLSIAFGVAIVAESLGSQIGLGYLIQTSNSNYSMHAIFLATIVLGFSNVCLDWGLVLMWKRVVYWRRDYRQRSMS